MFYSHILDTLQKSTSKQIETFQVLLINTNILSITYHSLQLKFINNKYKRDKSVSPSLGQHPVSFLHLALNPNRPIISVIPLLTRSLVEEI